jgi:hypothetical protein
VGIQVGTIIPVVLVVVKTGAITFYHGDDPTCTGTVHRAGTTFLEKGGDVGIARNEGAVEATPGNCAF